MSKDRKKFKELKPKRKYEVTFGGNDKCKITGASKVRNYISIVENMLLSEGLKYNLLSISQLCDKDLIVIFE